MAICCLRYIKSCTRRIIPLNPYPLTSAHVGILRVLRAQYTAANFDALATIRAACDSEGVSMVEAAYRWLLCHSALDGTRRDGVLLGASSVDQLDANLAACARARDAGPLPAAIVEAMSGAWTGSQALRDGAFPYWRSYSADMPGREALDHGAEYQAHGPK